jgi:hypothetical protein
MCGEGKEGWDWENIGVVKKEMKNTNGDVSLLSS